MLIYVRSSLQSNSRSDSVTSMTVYALEIKLCLQIFRFDLLVVVFNLFDDTIPWLFPSTQPLQCTE